GRQPHFLKNQAWELPPLRFHVCDQTFNYYKPSMQTDPLWIDLVTLFDRDRNGLGRITDALYRTPEGPARIGQYMQRLHRLQGILDRTIYTEYRHRSSE